MWHCINSAYWRRRAIISPSCNLYICADAAEDFGGIKWGVCDHKCLTTVSFVF